MTFSINFAALSKLLAPTLLTVLVIGVAACGGSQPHDPLTAIEAAFESHPIVELSRIEGTGNKTELNLIEHLLSDPRVQKDVNDIVVECANSLYQPLLDRYVSGGRVTNEQIRIVWRKTTQIIGCEADPTTEMLIDFVRDLNLRSADHPLRVLAADPPINWSTIHTGSQFNAYLFRRDRNAASVIERQVLARHRKALVIIGGDHFARVPSIGSGNDATITVHLEHNYPGSTYVIYDIEDWSRFNVSTRRMVASWQAPSIIPIAGTPLALEGGRPITAPDVMLHVGSRWIPVKNEYPGHTVGQLFDAVLYLGALNQLKTIELKEPTDQPYARELQHMRALVMGAPSPQ
ncbi:MAG: hypothetical protein WBW87_02150 [Candidatus Cybelea sp.]